MEDVRIEVELQNTKSKCYNTNQTEFYIDGL